MGQATLMGLSAVIELVLNMIQVLILASVIVSWVGADPYNPLVQIIQKTTEPLFRPFRALTRRLPGPFDWAPMIVLLIIVFLQRGLVPYLKILAINP